MYTAEGIMYTAEGIMYTKLPHDSRTCWSNYDSLIARTVAYPVQVAYWILRSWPPADTVSHVNFDQWSGDMAVGSCGLEAILA